MKQLVVTIESPSGTQYSVTAELDETQDINDQVQAVAAELKDALRQEGMENYEIVGSQIVEGTDNNRE